MICGTTLLAAKAATLKDACTSLPTNAGQRPTLLNEFHAALRSPFAIPLTAGLPAMPALCSCANDFISSS